MGKQQDILDEIMSDLGISDEIARSIRQTEEQAKIPINKDNDNRHASETTTPIPVTHVRSAVARNSDAYRNQAKLLTSNKKSVSGRKNISNNRASFDKKSHVARRNSDDKRTISHKNANRRAVSKTKPSYVKPSHLTKISKEVKSNNSAINKVNITLHVLVNVIFYSIAIILITKVAGMAFDFAYQIYGSDPVDNKPGKYIAIDIDKGTSSLDVAKQLEVNNLIKNKYSFLLRLKLSEKEIYASSYTLSTAMDYEEIISTICDYSKAEDEKEDSKSSKNKTKNSTTKDSKTKSNQTDKKDGDSK